nr:MAG TPA: tRNA(Ile)-lysidine synthase [Caudoviricetes sp.]
MNARIKPKHKLKRIQTVKDPVRSVVKSRRCVVMHSGGPASAYLLDHLSPMFDSILVVHLSDNRSFGASILEAVQKSVDRYDNCRLEIVNFDTPFEGVKDLFEAMNFVIKTIVKSTSIEEIYFSITKDFFFENKALQFFTNNEVNLLDFLKFDNLKVSLPFEKINRSEIIKIAIDADLDFLEDHNQFKLDGLYRLVRTNLCPALYNLASGDKYVENFKSA